MEMIEQRKNQRFDLRLPFEIIREGAKRGSAGETRNVSSSGVLFTSAEKMEIGDAIEYCITFPHPPGTKTEVKLRCVGKVLRRDPESCAATLERYEFQRG